MTKNEIDSPNRKRSFRGMVLSILDDNSGGMKLVELIAQLTAQAYEENNVDIIHDNIDFIEEELKKIPEIALTRYTWRTMNREKVFVCTK